ncbi:hypothetical protein BDZ97DRAFT_1914821 [Flammula alnicola]|nr:hypothetical protein BDZ97DRAFT_1914821 [Flammula alnicola]
MPTPKIDRVYIVVLAIFAMLAYLKPFIDRAVSKRVKRFVLWSDFPSFDVKSPDKDLLVFGPELYTYNDVAKILTSLLGREITHKKLSTEETATVFEGFGMSPDYANWLANLKSQRIGRLSTI